MAYLGNISIRCHRTSIDILRQRCFFRFRQIEEEFRLTPDRLAPESIEHLELAASS